MGRYVSMILNHSLSVGDYVFDYVKKSQSKEYYENYKIDATYRTDKGEEKTVKIPLTNFGKIRKNRLHYRFEIVYKKDWLNKILFDLLIKNKVDLSGRVFYGIYFSDDTKYVFLTTILIKDDMIFSNSMKKTYTLKTFDELEWIIKQGLSFSKNI